MRLLVMMFIIFVFALIQSLVPSFWWLNYARFPWLFSFSFYYAWRYDLYTALAAGCLSGLLQDLLSSFAPLGYSSLIFCASVIITKLLSKFVDVRDTRIFILSIIGIGELAIGVHYLLLARKGLIEPAINLFFYRVLSNAVLLCFCGVIVNVVMRFVSHVAGEQEEECLLEDVF